MATHRSIRLSVAGAAVLMALGAAPAASAASSPLPAAAEITRITSSTVTVQPLQANRSPEPISVRNLTVRLGPYPALPSDLTVGERVWLSGHAGSAERMVVRPQARGRLESESGQWILKVNPHLSFKLTASNPRLLGMDRLAAGERVLAFGTTRQNTLNDSALAAPPRRFWAKVDQNRNGSLKLTAGSKTWSYTTRHPRLANIPVGSEVGVLVNPATGIVLAVMGHPIRHLSGHAKIFGRVVSVSTHQLKLQNPVGTVDVALDGRKVKVKWPQHDQAGVAQIPKGAPVVVKAVKGGLTLRVMSP